MVHPLQPIQCSLCGLDETKVAFSKKQRKKAHKEQGIAKCTRCIESHAGEGTRTPSSEPVTPAPTTPPPVTTTTSSNAGKSKKRSSTDTTASTNTPLIATSPDLQDTIPRKKRKIPKSVLFDEEAHSDSNHHNDEDNDDGDENSLSPEDEGEHEVSIEAIKREVLGRDLHVETPIKDKDDLEDDLEQIRKLTFYSTKASTMSLADQLYSDMLCAICRDIHYPPISLSCGHSFCQDCLEWWEKTSPTCPTCRAESFSGRGTKLPQINGSLKQCLLGLYPSHVEQKLKSQNKTMIGERNGQHSRGYEELSPLPDEFWHAIATTPAIKVRRNIVLDGEDQRMQLAMGLYEVPTQLENGLIVPICLITMEEDEANDSGFPIVVSTHAEDEQFLCTNENRFRQSLLLVEMTKEDGSIAPVARISFQAMTMNLPGFVEYVLDASTCSFHAEVRVLRFRHDNTGATLELDLSLLQKGATGASFVSMDQRQRQHRQRQVMVMEQLDDEDEVEDENHEDDEEVGHDLDEFEDDSFVVQDEDDDEDESTSEKEGEFSGGEDNDENHEGCVYCKDGGELMICDGGAEVDGCGKSFHYECVTLPGIPEGDWICSDCAKEGGYTVDGRRGHEFPLPPKNDNDETQKKRFLSDDDSSSDEKSAESGDKDISGASFSKKTNNNKQSKRRIVLDESDDED